MHKAPNEAFDERNKTERTKGLRIWNEVIENAIKEKQNAYQNFLQRKCDKTEKAFKEKKKHKVKASVRTAHKMSREKFISKIVHDEHGRQTIAYKFLKSINSSIMDTASVNTFRKNHLLEHYKSLWYDHEKETVIDTREMDVNLNLITMREFQESLKNLKNRKTAGIDSLNPELIKYGGNILHHRMLNIFNSCWLKCNVPMK